MAANEEHHNSQASQRSDSSLPEESIGARIEVYQSYIRSLSERIENTLLTPDASLQQISLLAAQKIIVVMEAIVAEISVEQSPYFIQNWSDALNCSLVEEIFHLDDQQSFEEFVLRQLFGLSPDSMQPLPLVNRNEVAKNWQERFGSAEQAIRVEITGKGILRGLTDAEQDALFAALESGVIQGCVFPDEENHLLRSDLDSELAKFGQLLKQYIDLVKTLPPSAQFSVTREQQRFDCLIEIYQSPTFLMYQYYRRLLDHVDQEKKLGGINVLEYARRDLSEAKTTKTGDSDLDILFEKSNRVFVSWPTGEDQVYGQEHYLYHYFTEESVAQIDQVDRLSHDTPLLALVFDVSGSMLARDVEPSRFEYALDLQEELVQHLDDSIAIAQIIFSSMGIVSHPFGQEKNDLLDLLLDSRIWFHQARNDLVREMFGFTSLGAGLLSAVSLIDQTRKALNPWGTPPPAEVLLFTDGDHNCPPNFYQAAKFCKQRNIVVHTICCAKETVVEIETEEGNVFESLKEIVRQEAEVRTGKSKAWYADISYRRVFKKQFEIVLNQYRHRLQQDLQRSTGANVEALETITETTGGHFFPGVVGDKGPTTYKEIIDVLVLRSQLRDQIIKRKKQKDRDTQKASV